HASKGTRNRTLTGIHTCTLPISATDIVAQYIDGGGTLRTVLLNPSSATGSTATFAVPAYFNGAFAVSVVGSAFLPVLQVVPTVKIGRASCRDSGGSEVRMGLVC